MTLEDEGLVDVNIHAGLHPMPTIFVRHTHSPCYGLLASHGPQLGGMMLLHNNADVSSGSYWRLIVQPASVYR
jgi:hypothetical protein